jgi:hypothetical protein
VRDAATGQTTSNLVRIMDISNEEEAVQDPKLMDKSTFMKSDMV